MQQTKKIIVTEDLDTKTLSNRLGFLNSVTLREDSRFDDLVNKNSSKLIKDMILISINSYRRQQQELKKIINGR